MKNLFLVGLVLVSSTAQAGSGNGAGNGGKAIYCPDAGTYHVLDYERSVVEYGMTPIEDIPGESEYDIALKLIDRIANINPIRAHHYKQAIREFNENSRRVNDKDFPTTQDTKEISYCKRGVIEQVITQIEPKTEFQKRYIVHEDRYNKLSPFQKAILLTHEVILKETKALGYEDAESAVLFNVYLFSKELAVSSKEQYSRLLQVANLLYFDVIIKEKKSAIKNDVFGYVGHIYPLQWWGLSINALSVDLIQVECKKKQGIFGRFSEASFVFLPLSSKEEPKLGNMVFFASESFGNKRLTCKALKEYFSATNFKTGEKLVLDMGSPSSFNYWAHLYSVSKLEN